MIRRLTRLAGRAALGIAALALLGAGFLHAPAGRNLTRQILLGLLRRSGLEARLAGAQVNLARLEGRVSGLELAVPGHAAFVFVEEGRLRLSASSLWGRLGLVHLEVTGLRLSVEREPDGYWNLPQSAPSDAQRPLDLRRLLAGDIVLRDARLRARDPISGFEAEATALQLEWSGREGQGTLRADDGVRWRQLAASPAPADSPSLRHGHVAVSPARLARAGDVLTIEGPTLRVPEGSLALGGALEDLGGAPRLQAGAEGHADVVVAGLPVGLSISGRLVAGEANVEAEARVARGRVVATARLPTTGEASADVEWHGLDAATLLQAAAPSATLPVEGHVSGRLAARWPATAEDVARAATVEAHALVDATVRGVADGLDGGDRAAGQDAPTSAAWRARADLELRQGSYTLALDHDLASAGWLRGRLEGRLEPARLAETTLAGAVEIAVEEPGRLLRAAGLANPPPLTGRISATVGISGTLGNARATGPVVARGLRVPGGPPLDAEARLLAEGGRVQLDLSRAGGSGFGASGTLAVEPGGRLAGRLEARLDSLAEWAGAFPEGFAPSGSLSGQALVSGTVARPEADVELEGREVSLLGQPAARRVSGRLRVSASGLEVSSFAIEREQGRLEASGMASADGQVLALRAGSSDFALAPVPPSGLSATGLPLAARLDGQVDLRIEGASVAAAGRIALRELAFQGRALGEGTIEVTSSGTALQGELRLPALQATATVRAEPAPPHGLAAELRLDEASLEAWAQALGVARLELQGTTSLRARLEGVASNLDRSTVEVALERLDGTAGRVPFRLQRPATLIGSPERIAASGLELEAAGFKAKLDGALADDGAGSLALSIEGDLSGLNPLFAQKDQSGEDEEPLALTGQTELQARVTGTPRNPKPEASLTLTQGRVARGERVLSHSVAAQARFSGGVLRLERLEGDLGDVRVRVTGEAGAGLLEPSLPPPSTSWASALRSALAGDSRASFDLEAQPLQPEPVDAGSTGASGGKSAEEPLRIQAHLETDAADLRRLRGRADVRGLRFDLGEFTLRADDAFTALVENGRITVPEVSWKGGETDLRLGGAVLLADSVSRLAESGLELQASGVVDLRLLNRLGRGLEAGGVLRVRAEAGGSLAQPTFLGSAQLQDAVVSYRPWRLRLDDLGGSLVAERGRLVVEGLSGSLNGGTLSGGGSIELEGAKARSGALELTLDGATLDWPKGFQAGLDGSLALRGTPSGPLLAGTLTLANASYQGDPQTLVPTERSLSATEDDGRPGVLAGLALDVRLRTDSDVRVDNPFGKFAFGVDLRATGSAAAPRLAGQLEFQPQGYVYWSGRRFTLERGLLDWKATGGLLPFVQARATTRVSNYNVIADFSGPLDSAEARLVSDPPLSANEITSLLVTGSTSAGAADSRALGIVSANLLGNLGRHAGLDSVRIDAGDDQSLLNFDPTKVVGEANPAQRLTITKRLSANLEATVSLNLSESGKTTTFVSWKPWAAFEVRVAQRDDYTGSLEFRHDVALGGGSVVPPPRSATRASRAKPEVVSVVEIDDREQGGARPLTPKLKLRPGKTFSYEQWQQDRDRIEAAASRRNAQAYVVARREPRSPAPGGEVALTYVIDRGPRTAIRGRGLDLPASLRRDLRRAWARGDYDQSIEAEAEWRVREHLASEGYFIPRLRADVETGGDGTKTLVVTGERGPRLRGRRIVFEGAREVPRERFLSLVDGKDLLAQAWHEPERLERAAVAECVRDGFLAAKVKARPPVAEGDRAVLTVTIEEGPAFTRGDVLVTGCAAVPCAQVEEALTLPRGGRYRPEEIEAARARIVDLYRRGGWNAAQVRLAGKVRVATSSVDLEAGIDEGPRQVVQEVVVQGGAPGTRRALDPLVKLEPGDPVVLSDWAALRKRIYETGLVRGVSLEPEEAVAPPPAQAEAVAAPPQGGAASLAASPLAGVEPVVARLSYDEWPALRLRYGLQLVTEKPLTSTSDQAVDLGGTAELSRSTLFGRALSTGLSVEARASNWSVRGVLSVPRTFGRPVRSSLFLVREQEAFDVNVDRGSNPAPGRQDTWRLTFEERYRATRRLELALSYDIQWIEVGLSEFPGVAPFPFRPARIIPSVLMDGRNNILDPTRGYFSSLTYNFGAKVLGSEFAFTRLFTQQFAYLPLPGGLVFASGLRFERSAGDSGQAFLSTERLAFGGPTTIRGYERNEIELFDLLSAVGATTKVLILNQEARFPILGDLHGVAFFDYGQLRVTLEGVSGSVTRMGAGLGLRYSTPVGVLRFDVGVPLRGEERKARYYFGLGQAF